ncbi:MAG: hypothetical protein P8170_04265 [Gemmatimonadota bacterium]|jgi:hypothetical protein
MSFVILTPRSYSVVLACLISFFAAAQPTAAQGCAQCTELACEENEHANEDCPWCILGNLDSPHSCFAFTCEFMVGEGIHVGDEPCNRFASRAALDDLRSLPQVFADAIPTLLARHPDQLVVDADLDVVQVLDCRRDLVIAQFEIALPDELPVVSGAAWNAARF